jgi:hypothetical protein
VNIASASSQTVPAFNFGNLNINGGARTLSSTGTIGICGTYTPTAGALTVGTSTVNFNGSAQTIPASSYNNVTITTTSSDNNNKHHKNDDAIACRRAPDTVIDDSNAELLPWPRMFFDVLLYFILSHK